MRSYRNSTIIPRFSCCKWTKILEKVQKKRALIPALDTESIEEHVVPDVHLMMLKEMKSELNEILRDIEINVFSKRKLEGDCRYFPTHRKGKEEKKLTVNE